MQPSLMPAEMKYVICVHCYHAFSALSTSPSALDKTCPKCFWDPSAEEHRKQIGIINPLKSTQKPRTGTGVRNARR